jgi:hypothetical protein
MSLRERLSSSQIVIVRSVHTRGGAFRPVALDARWQREFLVGLCRRGLIEIWYRQSVGDDFSLRGPFLTLSAAGARMAARFVRPAPRGISGAEQRV